MADVTLSLDQVYDLSLAALTGSGASGANAAPVAAKESSMAKADCA